MLYENLIEKMKETGKFKFKENNQKEELCEVNVKFVDNELTIDLKRNDFLYNTANVFTVNNVFFRIHTKSFMVEMFEDKAFSIMNNDDIEPFAMLINRLMFKNTRNFQKHKTTMTLENINFMFDNINVGKKELADMLEINYDLDIKKDRIFSTLVEELCQFSDLMSNKLKEPTKETKNKM